MELWVRSQDKTRLVKVDHIYYMENMFTNDVEDKYYICSGGAFDLGVYSTKERALEILDEIQEHIENYGEIFAESNNGIVSNFKYYGSVYEMPKK